MASSSPLLVTDASGRGFPGAARRPWALLIAGVGLVLLIDLIIALVRPPTTTEPVLADDLPRARATLHAAIEHENGWLVLGDSVLAGDVMQGTVDDWSEHRVLDSLRQEQSHEAQVAFSQIALDGMLPVDMLRLIYELNTLDPTGRVGVVIEINPRFFSTHYAKQRECSRPFLCELGLRDTRPRRYSWATVAWDESWRWLGEHLPVVRHRDAFPPWREETIAALTPRLEPESDGTTTTAADDPLIGRARILEHYRGLLLDRRSIQFRALRAVVAELRARGRRALLFATPLSDEFMAGTLDGNRYGGYIAALDHLINRADDTTVRFASLDHPRLTDPHFIDHAHLGPRGNRWLAINLLHQLGIPLAHTPEPGTLVYEEGPDRSLVTRIERGSSDGAPWQAALTKPHGLAVSPGAGRVVVADTGNHCVRELVGPHSTVRTLAGMPTESGSANGRVKDARFIAPRLPVLLGDRVVVVDGKKRERLRMIADGQVRTLKPTEGPRWARVDRIRSDGRALWLIDRARQIMRFDPDTGVSTIVLPRHSAGLSALDVGPDGRVYFADANARIWQLSPGDPKPVLLFANTAQELLPQSEGDFFPFTFDQMALERVTDLRYIDRYDGVLVQDEHSAKAHASTVTERIHLRLLSFSDGRIYPWVRPLAHGGGQMFHNRHTEALSSNVHRGSMAIDPDSTTLFYLERERSRLLQLSDGLLGTAKLGHHITSATYGGLKDVFGRAAGTTTMLVHHPERWLFRRLEALPRRGPYLGLVLGSSLTSVTDVVGQYSMARVMERQLGRALGVRDTVRLDLVQRAFRGPRLEHLVSAFESFVEHQAPLDVVFIEAHSGRMYRAYKRQGEMIEPIDRIRRAALRYDTLVVVLDAQSMASNKRDGLRGPTTKHTDFLDLCESAGFLVLRPGDLLLRDSIDHAPWGNAPFKGPHGSTWAVDLTARAFADLTYPALREHLRDRVPALMRPRAEKVAIVAPLYEAFSEASDDWASLARTVPPEAMQRRMDGSRIELLVDLGKAGASGELTREQEDELALGYLVLALLRDPAGRLASEVHLTLAQFSNYDEYGVGVLDGAQIVDQRTLDKADLLTFLVRMGGVAPADDGVDDVGVEGDPSDGGGSDSGGSGSEVRASTSDG
ncbi:MAG: hypothetical protein K0V04_15460 [Deltaproteobacteria bacterium]|nr:hypothetical protein [Deltaproteobacteria bacterium]